MPTHTNIGYVDQVVETVFVGAAMKTVATQIMQHDVPVHARHMRSIDDLLMHVEDHQVECAVVDQSLPTESRGVKLVLLAGFNKVKHLIVVASPNNDAEIAAIDGVHKVLSGPASHEEIIAAVRQQTRQAAPTTLAAASSKVAAHETGPHTATLQIKSRFANLCGKFSALVGTRHEVSQYNLSMLSKRLQTRPVMATVASLFVCLSTVAAVSLVSDSSALLVDSARKHTVADEPRLAADTRTTRPHQAEQAVNQTDFALQAAELSRREAASSLQGSLRTIELEIWQQRELRKDVLANISRLNAIIGDLGTARKEVNTGQSGSSSSLAEHTRFAKVKIELALQELEFSKIDNVLGNLNLLKSRISPPKAGSFKLADIGSSGISE